MVVLGGMLALLTDFQICDWVTSDVLHQLVLLVRCLLQVEEPILLMVLLAVFHSKVMQINQVLVDFHNFFLLVSQLQLVFSGIAPFLLLNKFLNLCCVHAL